MRSEDRSFYRQMKGEHQRLKGNYDEYLNQREYWIRNGGLTPIISMDDDYRANAARWLLDHAAQCAERYISAVDRLVWSCPDDGVLAGWESEQAQILAQPRVWIARTELYKALAKDIVIEGAPEEVVPYGSEEPVWINAEEANELGYEEQAGVIEMALKILLLERQRRGSGGVYMSTKHQLYDQAEALNLDITRDGDGGYTLELVVVPAVPAQPLNALRKALGDEMGNWAPDDMRDTDIVAQESAQRLLEALENQGFEVRKKEE